ncbi:MAG: Enoyl-CoA hydratase [Enhydrobacter sp.]|jgi:enoyl-CoA hydratase/carnithine racemase|nr:MAG: Enoyl-CoA hydratase [Enhydrobacter sp.]
MAGENQCGAENKAVNETKLQVAVDAGVATVLMNRPEARNALSSDIVLELTKVLDRLEADDSVAVLVLGGTGRDFAAGADIREMVEMSVQHVAATDFSGCCARLGDFPKPVIAAVGGYALGGGCELVEMCDIVIAADNARFGHPEITLGTMSGAGGTQRLPRLVGRHVALDVLLTGRMLTASEAQMFGLVSRIVCEDKLMEEAGAVARRIAAFPAAVARLIKESVIHAESMTLPDGLAFERKLFHLTFAMPERRKLMESFVRKSKTA